MQVEKPSNFTGEQVDWLLEHRCDGCMDEVIDMFNERFTDRRLSYSGLCSFLRRRGLSGGKGMRGASKVPKEEREWLRERASSLSGRDNLDSCVDEFMEAFPNTETTRGRARCVMRGVTRRKTGGDKRFKPGNRPMNWHPVGTEREWHDGNVYVKFREPRKSDRHTHECWVRKSKLVWEEANGRELAKDAFVVFADGDKRNFDPSNLVEVPRRTMATINAMGLPYSDAETLSMAVDIANLTMEAKRVCVESGIDWRQVKKRSELQCEAASGQEH